MLVSHNWLLDYYLFFNNYRLLNSNLPLGNGRRLSNNRTIDLRSFNHSRLVDDSWLLDYSRNISDHRLLNSNRHSNDDRLVSHYRLLGYNLLLSDSRLLGYYLLLNNRTIDRLRSLSDDRSLDDNLLLHNQMASDVHLQSFSHSRLLGSDRHFSDDWRGRLRGNRVAEDTQRMLLWLGLRARCHSRREALDCV